jgi:hypothetical protein
LVVRRTGIKVPVLKPEPVFVFAPATDVEFGVDPDDDEYVQGGYQRGEGASKSE